MSESESMSISLAEQRFGVAARDRFRSLPLAAVVCVLLLFVQSATLSHSHEDDLRLRYDCDICLKIGSSTDAVTASPLAESTTPQQQEWLDRKAEPLFPRLLDLHARAPPKA